MKATLTFKKKDNWSGYSIYKNCKHAIGPYLKRTGILYTGLDDDVLRLRLEKELGLDLSKKSEFWKTFNVFITDRNVVLDTDIPEQELKYYFLKNHKDVAFGLNDRKPSAKYMLVQAEEEAMENNVKTRIKRKAISEFDRMTPEQMRKALRLYGYNSTNISPELAEDRLYKLVEEDPNKFLLIWVDNNNKDTQFLIEEAAAKGILVKNKSTYKYGTDIIGHSLQDVINHLDNPINADLKMAIKAQLQNKDITLGNKKAKERKQETQFSKLMNEIETEDTKE